MKVIAINEHGNDWPIAVVKIPDGKTADDAFVAWFKLHSNQASYAEENNWSDEQILTEALNVWEELVVQILE
jgi:hypothetical protein